MSLKYYALGWVYILLFASLPAWSSAQNTDPFSKEKAISSWLNSQLENAGSQARIFDEECVLGPEGEETNTACTYKYADSAYLMLASDEENITSFSLSYLFSKSKDHDIDRDTMKIFSFLIWSSMSIEAQYSEANSLLLDLYERSFQPEGATTVSHGWSFGIADLELCSLPMSVFAGTQLQTGFDAESVFTVVLNYPCPPELMKQ